MKKILALGLLALLSGCVTYYPEDGDEAYYADRPVYYVDSPIYYTHGLIWTDRYWRIPPRRYPPPPRYRHGGYKAPFHAPPPRIHRPPPPHFGKGPNPRPGHAAPPRPPQQARKGTPPRKPDAWQKSSPSKPSANTSGRSTPRTQAAPRPSQNNRMGANTGRSGGAGFSRRR